MHEPTLHERTLIDTSGCPIALSLDVLGQKWTLLIVREAVNGVERFTDFEAVLHCPRNLLSERLKMLCDAGIFASEPYEVLGERARSRYVLTEAGKELVPTLVALFDWGRRHLPMPDDPPGGTPYCGCGSEVHAELRCEAGHRVAGIDEMTLLKGPPLHTA